MPKYYDVEPSEDRRGYQKAGSALRKASPKNPRIYPCPTCLKPNKLTAADVRREYQCDACADQDECGW